MPSESLCITHKKSVLDHEIRITVTHTGSRSFSVLKRADRSMVATGTIHWGAETPVRFHHGSRVPTLDFNEEILRASYDMYLR